MSTTTVHPYVLRASSFTVKAVEFAVEAVVLYLELAFALIQSLVEITLKGINAFFAWLDKRAARNKAIRDEERRFKRRCEIQAKAQAKYGSRRHGLGFFAKVRLFLVWGLMAYITFKFILPAYIG